LTNRQTISEEVDIAEEAEDLDVFSAGSLEELDEKKRIDVHWFKEKMIAWLSLTVIITLLFLSIYLILWSDDPETRDWGKQIATTLLGFAAGAIWQGQKK